MKYNVYGASINSQYPVLGLEMKSDSEKENIKKFYRVLLKNRFIRVELHKYYYARAQTGDLLNKLNRRHRSTLIKISLEILESLGCSNFEVQKGDFGFHQIHCDTSFGRRSIRALRFCYMAPFQSSFDDAMIWIPLISSKFPGILNFKNEKGDLQAIIEEDFTKHYGLIKDKVFDNFPILSELGATIEFRDCMDQCY